MSAVHKLTARLTLKKNGMIRISALLLLLFTTNVMAQLPIPKNIRTAYEAGTRSKNGQPGPKYWQNTAKYNLNIQFDPASLMIRGKEHIVYVNNSPDTLKQIVFKLYPNLYQKGSPRLMAMDSSDVGAGMNITSINLNNAELMESDYRVFNTNMFVRGRVSPGSSVSFDIEYSYKLNKTSHIRTGEIVPGADFVAYFFPRIAVYDDIDGWNLNPYLGTQEFYNDFCDFDLAVTVPGKYLVWATGDQTNMSETFRATYIHRIKEASLKDAYITIADTTETRQGKVTLGDSLLTWKFTASHITDVVFAVSDHYKWVSSSVMVDPVTKRRTRVDAIYDPVHADYELVAQDARKTVEYMSYRFPKWPFPFPHISVFDGLDQMEYPMLVNDNPLEDRHESIELTDHEIFHSMFPFYMGINETKYGWMDEGWATIGEWLISPMIDSTIIDRYGVLRYSLAAGKEHDLPVTTLTTQQFGESMFINSYPKPGMGYLFVKDMLGDSLFFRGLHHYIRTWHGKHPMPYDFFYSMNEGTGKNLDWFWKKWFFENGEPDLAIGKISGNNSSRRVSVLCKGTKPVPVELTVIYADGTKEFIYRSIAVWEKGAKQINIPLAGIKKIKSLKLEGVHTPDSNPLDNELILRN